MFHTLCCVSIANFEHVIASWDVNGILIEVKNTNLPEFKCFRYSENACQLSGFDFAFRCASS